LEGSQLESTITAHAQHVIETNTTAGQPGLSVQPVTVLIIEDSAVQRQSLVLTLQKAGYQVLQAVNGQEGSLNCINILKLT
jgi:PleD family two-component response regulator